MVKVRHEHKAIKALEKLEAKSDVRFFIAGGYVRDTLRNKPPKDVDIVATNIDFENLVALLRTEGETKTINFSSTKFGIVLFRVDRNEIIEVALPRSEHSTGFGHKDFDVTKGPDITLEQDSARRDFRINAMYLPVGYRSKKEVIDYQGGVQDIKERRITFVGSADDRIKEDPLRMLRLVSLQSRTGYKIDPSAINAVRNNADLVREIPADCIKNELETMLLSSKPSRSIRLLAKLKLLNTIIPELDACRGIKQEKAYHRYDIFTHCIKACDIAEPTLALRYAALLHDIGKLEVKKWNEKKRRLTFYNHHKVSASRARDILKRLRLDKKLIEEICFLIAMHMYDYRAQWKNRTVRKFIKKVGITKNDLDKLERIPLFQLRIADRLGSGFKSIPITERQKAFEERIRFAFDEAEIFGMEDLAIDGHDIANHLRKVPGPKIGVILDKLLDVVMESPLLNNKKDLLDLASEISEKIDKLDIGPCKHWGDWKRKVLKLV